MRIFKYALKNIKRNAFLSISSVLVLTLIIFFINILLLVNHTTDILIQNINQRLTLSVTLNKGYTNENSEVIDLITGMRSLGNGILVTYVSPEEALSTMQTRDPELTKLVEDPTENPLPASIKIENVSLGQYDELDGVISKYKTAIVFDEKKFKKKIIDYKAQYERINGVIKVFTSIKFGIYGIILFFVFSVFIIIYNIIGNFIFFYRDEIKITKLVGGDNIFIYGPFSVQGFLYTLFSACLSFIVFLYIIKTINIYLIDDFPGFINKFLTKNASYFIYEIGSLSIIGLFSGFLSSHKFIGKAGAKEKLI